MSKNLPKSGFTIPKDGDPKKTWGDANITGDLDQTNGVGLLPAIDEIIGEMYETPTDILTSDLKLNAKLSTGAAGDGEVQILNDTQNIVKSIKSDSILFTDAGDSISAEIFAGEGIDITNNVITNIGGEIQIWNDNGFTLEKGRVVHLKSATFQGGEYYQTVEYANAENWEKIQGTLYFVTEDIINNTNGRVASYVKNLSGVDTSMWSAGSQLWLSCTNDGELTDIKPQFPCFSISCGGNYNSQVDGNLLLNFTTDVYDTFHDAWDGGIRETFNFTASSDGTTVTGLLENVIATDNLTLMLSDGFFTLDTTTAPLTINLTAGTDSLTVTNYVFIPIDTKAVTVNTTGFPDTEHCKIAQCEVQSALSVQNDGGLYRNQNINDHLKKNEDNGHVLHITERLRQFNAEYESGVESTFDNAGGGGLISTTSGVVWQLHRQNVPAINMATGDLIRIVNDFTTTYRRTANLNTITQYSDGSSWNNDWSKVVVWGVANKSGQASFLFCNLPSDGYNSEANAIADGLGYADYSIPKKYRGVGFLIGAFTIRISGGNITYNGGDAYQDLRGFVPNNIAGGGSGGSGTTSFLGLLDTPLSYTGFAGYVPKVNATETALEFEDLALYRKLTNNSFTDDVDMNGNDINSADVVNANNGTFNSLNIQNTSDAFLKVYGDIGNIDETKTGVVDIGWDSTNINEALGGLKLRGTGDGSLNYGFLGEPNNAVLIHRAGGVETPMIEFNSTKVAINSDFEMGGNDIKSADSLSAVSGSFSSSLKVNGDDVVTADDIIGYRELIDGTFEVDVDMTGYNIDDVDTLGASSINLIGAEFEKIRLQRSPSTEYWTVNISDSVLTFRCSLNSKNVRFRNDKIDSEIDIETSGVFKVDGDAGQTGSFEDKFGNVITVKGGLITGGLV